MARRRRGDRGQRRAGHGRPRRSSTSASLLVNSAYLRRRTRSRRSGRPTCSTSSAYRAGCVDFVAPGREGFGIRVSFAEPEPSTCRRSPGGHPARLAPRSPSPAAVGSRIVRSGRLTMHRAPQPAHVAAVALLLGLLVVVQLRSQAGGAGLAPAVVAGPDGPRGEPEHPQRPAAARDRSLQRQLATLNAEPARAATSRSTSSAPTSTGPGVGRPRSRGRARASRSRSAAPIDGQWRRGPLNELRNAGAEAIAIDDVRVVTGRRRQRRAGQADGRRHAARRPVRDPRRSGRPRR